MAELEGSPQGSARHDLLTALRHAGVRAEHDPWGSPEHVRYAQAVLEIAVEWAMPAVERWAVAWLTAAGVSYLRLRWSSRSRDGRTRRDGLAPSAVSAIIADSGRAIIGCESGYVAQWTDDAGLSAIHAPAGPEPAVWAVACRGDRVFAVDDHGNVRTRPEDWSVPAPSESLNARVQAAAISKDGDVACGDNAGRLLICPAGGTWLLPLRPPEDRRGASIKALSFDARSSVWAVWENGWVTETRRRGPGGTWIWHKAEQPHPGRVTAAAFDSACGRAAICYAGGGVSVLHLREMSPIPCWPRDTHGIGRIGAVAWSSGGLLALARTESLLFGQPDQAPEQITGDGTGDRVAFLDEDHLVTTREREIVGWAIHEAGSDVPDQPQSAITAVAVDPLDPGRTMVGTANGGVLRYDERGWPTRLVKDRGPIVGQVHELTRMGDGWLIAAHGGAYRVTHGDVSRLPGTPGMASYVCRSVAVTGQGEPPPDGAYACHDRVRAVSGGELLALARPVRDVRGSADGAVGAIADDGSIHVRDRAGAGWSPPGPRPRPGRPGRSGWRLLAASATSVTVWSPADQSEQEPDGQVRRFSRYGQDVQLGRLPSDATAALSLGAAGIVVGCPDRGVSLADIGESRPAGRITGVSTRVTAIGANGHRIVAAAGQRIAGYDLMPAAERADGVIRIRVAADGGTCRVTLPAGQGIELDPGLVAEFRENSPGLVDTASRIGDQLWRCGLDRALDLARGVDPDRPVRLAWDCDAATDDLPWELVRPAMSPLGWFADPPVTSVRSVRPPDSARAGPASPAAGSMTRHRMQVIRGTGPELDPSGEAYLQTSRRIRLRNVRLLDPEPVRIASQENLDDALREPVDILQVWAHCGPHRAEFSDDFWFGTADLADLLAPQVSRLVIIVGCRSGALARELVQRGVEAVVAMRTEVFSGTIQPMVADLIALALGGMPIDLSFSRALHSYVLTGQPGAAATPMLYLADGSTGELFG